MVQEICRDIKKLDFAKKHITTTITALHRLTMLGTEHSCKVKIYCIILNSMWSNIPWNYLFWEWRLQKNTGSFVIKSDHIFINHVHDFKKHHQTIKGISFPECKYSAGCILYSYQLHCHFLYNLQSQLLNNFKWWLQDVNTRRLLHSLR